LNRQKIPVKVFSSGGPGHSTIRTDQPQVESKLDSHGESECMPPAGDQDYFRARGMGVPQGIDISGRHLEL
jgi:hypothetical protein